VRPVGAPALRSIPTTTYSPRSSCWRRSRAAACTALCMPRRARSMATSRPADPRGHAAPSCVALWRDQAGRRAPVQPVRVNWGVPAAACATLPSTALTSGLTWPSTSSSAMLRDEPLSLYGDGEQTRDFTFIDDVVEANVRAVDAPPGGCSTSPVGRGDCKPGHHHAGRSDRPRPS